MAVPRSVGWIWIALVSGWGDDLAWAQATDMQPQGQLIKRTYVSSIDGAEIDYALWLPPGHVAGAAQAWPLIVFLHGSGEGTNWESPTKVRASIPVLGARSDLPFMVAFPLMRGSWSINSLAELDILETLADVKANFAVDPDRVHLVGLSLGGFAGWRFACRYPQLLASGTFLCGGGEPDLAANLRHVALRVYHGARDPVVAVQRSREMVAALKEADIPVQYIEEPQGTHNVWSGPLGSRKLYDWIANQRRVATPRRVSHRTYTLRHGRAYWVSIESMIDPSVPAYVDAFLPPGLTQVFIQVDNVGRLMLNPPTEILEGSQPLTFLVNDRPIAGTKTERGWLIDLPGLPNGDRIKRPGLAGPIQDVLHGPFVVSVANPADAARRQAWAHAAELAFAWSDRLTANNISTIAAEQVTADLMAHNHLICFGDATDHPLLAELVGKVPLHADAGRIYLDGQPLAESLAAFVMIYPNPLAPHRYIVICSGQPAAVGTLAAGALTPPYLNPEPIEDLLLLGHDGKLFTWTDQPPAAPEPPAMGARLPPRGTVFDAAWRLTPAARKRLTSTGSP